MCGVAGFCDFSKKLALEDLKNMAEDKISILSKNIENDEIVNFSQKINNHA